MKARGLSSSPHIQHGDVKMTTLKESSLKGLLEKARQVGIIEEAVSVQGHNMVLRNLRPEEYTELYEELQAFVNNEPEYWHSSHIEHVSRSLVEIDGEDFRDVQFIEVEREDPKNPGTLVPVNVPRHEWVRDNLVSQWSREVIFVLFRKFMDVASEADRISREGVVFKVADETDEEKFRRLLAEALESGSDVPDDMKEAILQEHGLLLATSAEELERANEEAKRFLEEQRKQAQAAEEAATEDAVAEEEPWEPTAATTEAANVPEQIRQALSQEDPETIMAARQPLNRTPIRAPVPQPAEGRVTVANKRPPAPPAQQVASAVNARAAQRAAEFAALEAEAAANGIPLGDTVSAAYQIQPDLGTILEAPLREGAHQSKLSIDARPKGGVNRKFVDGTKGGGLNPRRS